jgi:arylsulfatase A-like enzyme
MLPTLLAAAGEPDIVEKCKKGYKAGDRTYKVHLDGYNLVPYFKGDLKQSPRPGFLYWGDEGDLMALRYGNWKIHFAVQDHEGAKAWEQALTTLKTPLLVNLRTDPFEEASLSADLYLWKWRIDHIYMLLPAGAIVGEFMKTMIEFPPRQSPESWTPEAMLEGIRKKAEALKAAAHAG